MFHINDPSNAVETQMMFPSKIPVSLRHNFKDLNFSEFMLDFHPKRHQLQILANNINKGGHTLVSGTMREGVSPSSKSSYVWGVRESYVC